MVKKAVIMFVFSKPQPRAEDLEQWRLWFISRGKYSYIRERTDGEFDLLVEGAEVTSMLKPEAQDPVMQPCKYCGGWPKKSPSYTEGFIPLMYCCPEHMEAHRKQAEAKYENS